MTQVKTVPITVKRIMSTREFARGFGDARKGVPFDWRIGTENGGEWGYERGRLLAHIAPLDMPLWINGKLNPEAVALYAAASKRRLGDMKPRSLDIIADDINKLERGSIFDIGDLLLEAKAQCQHGQWAKWIWDNFEYCEATAQRYMQAAKLATKYRTVRDLKVSARTIYALAGEDEEHLPSIVQELAKHATKTRLTVLDAEHIIKIGRGRGLCLDDDLPDPVLVHVGQFHEPGQKWLCPWIDRATAELKKQKPTTMDAANDIIFKIDMQHRDALAKKQVKALAKKQTDADAILDGPPPILPPSIVPPEPQTIGVEDDDDQSAEAEIFEAAMEKLHLLRAKPLTKFTDVCTPKRLQEVIDFLNAILAKLPIEVAP
jgi:hypothetical protein